LLHAILLTLLAGADAGFPRAHRRTRQHRWWALSAGASDSGGTEV